MHEIGKYGKDTEAFGYTCRMDIDDQEGRKPYKGRLRVERGASTPFFLMYEIKFSVCFSFLLLEHKEKQIKTGHLSKQQTGGGGRRVRKWDRLS